VKAIRIVSLIALTCAVAAACTTGGEDGGEASGARLTSTGGDVFGWSQRIEGTGSCDAVEVLVDGAAAEVPVEIEGGTFAFEVPVATGEQEVAARCTVGDGASVDTQPITLTGMLEPRPTARIDVRVRGSQVTFDGGGSEVAEPDGAEIVEYVWWPKTQIGEAPPDLEIDGRPWKGPVTGRRITVDVPPQDGELYVSLTVEDAEGRTDTSTTYVVAEGENVREPDLATEHPSWIDSAVVYAPVHQLWGGGFRNVEKRLGYLKDLGVDALWLWPPVTTRASGEEYAIADYFTIDPEWGTPKEMKRFVQAAHDEGIRVLLDFVPNHSSIEHRYAQAAEEEGPGSHYWDFYDRDDEGNFTYYFDWEHLPNLNYDDPQVRRMMTEAFAYWVREFDVDGFRVDAAWGIQRRAPDYWPEWRAELKRIEPDLLLIAEATARRGYYFQNGFDVGYDWADSPGQWAWASVWNFPEEAQGLLVPALTNQDKGYPRDALVLRFINNNDTDVRFVDQHGPELTRVAAALEFTVPGVPLLFGGDEIGANYVPYSNLTKIPWKDRFGLRPWYDELIRMRDELPALRSHDMRVLSTDESGVLAFVRPAVPGGDPVLVVLNFSKGARATIARDPELDRVLARGPFVDAISGEPVSLPSQGEVTIQMSADGVHVLVPASGA
jgi:glycosidase